MYPKGGREQGPLDCTAVSPEPPWDKRVSGISCSTAEGSHQCQGTGPSLVNVAKLPAALLHLQSTVCCLSRPMIMNIFG